MSLADPANSHATALVVGDRGILIAGASGSGKTTLAIALVSRLVAQGRFARLVADDQVLLTCRGGRLVCTAPASIAGLVEIRGRMPGRIAFEPRAVIDLMVRLVPEHAAPRLAADAVELVEGCALPVIRLAERNAEGAVAALLSWLGHPPFV